VAQKLKGPALKGLAHYFFSLSIMNTQRKPSVFSQMNKANYAKSDSGGYRAWKQKEEEVKKEKGINSASFTEFPDLVQPVTKKTVFEGASLAMKLKEAIAAEEEEAIQKRLKKGITPETILREMCVSLPIKGLRVSTEPLEVPSWVTDNTKPFIMRPFRPKSMKQLAEERRWRRLGINPHELMLEDETGYEDDKISLPSDEIPPSMEQDETIFEEEVYQE
jgi:hypothetical protein